MLLFYYLITYVIGLVFGSFLNVVSDRIVNGGSILVGRSKCDSCKKTLKAKDLIPVVSFFVAKGKCRYCKSKLAYYYPLSELLTGIVFVGIASYVKLFESFTATTLLSFIFLISVSCFYIVLFLTDAKYRLIPNKVVYSSIIFVLTFLIFKIGFEYLNIRATLVNDTFGKYMLKAGYAEGQLLFEAKNLVMTVLSAFGISAFFIFLIKITKGRGMGGGDVTLGFLIGLVNGFPNNLLAIFLGFVLGASYSVLLIALGKKSMKDTIPFGPFLILGSVLTYFFSTQIFNWYFGLF